ncbi:Ig domain protein [Leptospira sp. 201903071]|uniref:putative Ig domain-containing protein n=1 Tax=Leptospira ainazelensis TaxID=2810034 RepID=UPI0019660547|nr:putative Ig domain-containing protein [Leptospira ainazelensis]MBM9500262.1 Ig domain protein [Leptospira ainazelensis]
MKKTLTILLIMGLFITSCEDETKEAGTVTGNSMTDLLLLAGISSGSTNSAPCPTDVTISNSALTAQVGSSLKSEAGMIRFTAPSPSSNSFISSEAISGNRNCQFSNYTAANLPAGLGINSTTGLINGTPTAAGGPTAVSLSVVFKPNNGSSITLTKTIDVNVHVAGNLTCNTVGISAGCTAGNPYSCSNSTTCWNSYSSCTASSSCGY